MDGDTDRPSQDGDRASRGAPPRPDVPGSASWLVATAMVVVVAVWGAAFSGIKILLEDLSPQALTAGRLLVAAVFYTMFLPLAPAGRVQRRPGDLPRLVVAGVASSAGYHLAINFGEVEVSAGLASLIVAVMPAMVAVAEATVLRERLEPLRAAGLFAAFAGVGLLIVASGRGVAASSVRGILVTLLAPISWTVYTTVAKPLASRYDGVRLNLIGSWVGAIAVLPFGLVELDAFAGLGAAGWAWLLYLGAVSTAAAYVVYAWALRSWRASSVASAVYLVPAASMLWAWGLLGEVPSVWAVAGGALIVGGVVLVGRRR